MSLYKVRIHSRNSTQIYDIFNASVFEGGSDLFEPTRDLFVLLALHFYFNLDSLKITQVQLALLGS